MIDIIYWFPIVPTILTQSSDVNRIPLKNSNNTSQMTTILKPTQLCNREADKVYNKIAKEEED